MIKVKSDDNGILDVLRNARRREIVDPIGVASGVAVEARQKASSLGSVHRHASAGIRQAQNQIRLDTGQHPEILGAEFGGGRRSSTRQFPPYRGKGPSAGYFLWPTIRAADKAIAREIERKLDRLFR